MISHFQSDHTFATQLDTQDPLRTFKKLFYCNKNQIYLDGHSLGLLSNAAEETLLRALLEWKTLAINGWTKANTPWFYFAEELAKQQAPLFGAQAEEIIIHSSTTVNIHALLSTFYQPTAERYKIIVDEFAFPSDYYAVNSQLLLKNQLPEKALKIVKSRDGYLLEEQDIIKAMTLDVACIFLPSVVYRSGQLLDMALLTREAHKRNIIIGFDCAHSAGALPHALSEWQVDFACWCNYKHCNGGPGAPAGIFIHHKHFDKRPALSGWFGYKKEKQFDMLQVFEWEKNAAGWQTGTPHILSMAPLQGALQIIDKAGINAIREKSLQLTDYMIFLIDEILADYGFLITSPREAEKRGGHIALEHQEAIGINAALKDAYGIITDFRMPDIIRLAPVALYNTFDDVWKTVQAIKKIMTGNAYRNYPQRPDIVA